MNYILTCQSVDLSQRLILKVDIKNSRTKLSERENILAMICLDIKMRIVIDC